jgi:sugar phosphate isomerase/epimerase
MAHPLDAVGMCPATLLPDPFSATNEAFEGAIRDAVAAGFETFSLWADWPGGYGIERTADLLRSLGATAPAVEAARQWPLGAADAAAEATAFADVATAFGAQMVAACALEPVESWPAAVAGFRALCDIAGARDLRVCVEFIPCTGVPDLATAWRLIEESGAANGGILDDIMQWHHQESGPDFSMLEQIPGERIHYVQACDTVTADAVPGAYMDEALTNRRLPGEGDVDIERLLGTLERIGAAPWFAYEVFNRRLASEGSDAMTSRLAACRIG